MMSYKLDLLSNPEQVTSIPGWLNSILQKNSPLCEIQIVEIRYAVVEAVNNSIEHAYEKQVDRPITLSCDIEPDRIHITIRDNGRPIPSAFPVTGNSPTAESGRGLVIIEAMTDAIHRERVAGWNVTRLVKFIR